MNCIQNQIKQNSALEINPFQLLLESYLAAMRRLAEGDQAAADAIRRTLQTFLSLLPALPSLAICADAERLTPFIDGDQTDRRRQAAIIARMRSMAHVDRQQKRLAAVLNQQPITPETSSEFPAPAAANPISPLASARTAPHEAHTARSAERSALPPNPTSATRNPDKPILPCPVPRIMPTVPKHRPLPRLCPNAPFLPGTLCPLEDAPAIDLHLRSVLAEKF